MWDNWHREQWRSENNWWERDDLSWSIIQRHRNNLLNLTVTAQILENFKEIMKKANSSKWDKRTVLCCHEYTRAIIVRSNSLLGMWSLLSEIWSSVLKRLTWNLRQWLLVDQQTRWSLLWLGKYESCPLKIEIFKNCKISLKPKNLGIFPHEWEGEKLIGSEQTIRVSWLWGQNH